MSSPARCSRRGTSSGAACTAVVRLVMRGFSTRRTYPCAVGRKRRTKRPTAWCPATFSLRSASTRHNRVHAGSGGGRRGATGPLPQDRPGGRGVRRRREIGRASGGERGGRYGWIQV